MVSVTTSGFPYSLIVYVFVVGAAAGVIVVTSIVVVVVGDVARENISWTMRGLTDSRFFPSP